MAAQVTIRSKLALGLFTIAVVLLLPLGLALRSLERLYDTTAQLRRSEFAASLLLNRMRSETDQLRRAEISMLFVHDSSSRAAMDTQVQRVAAMANSPSASFERMVTCATRSLGDGGRATGVSARSCGRGSSCAFWLASEGGRSWNAVYL